MSIYYRFQVLSKDVVKTKQLLVGASGTEEPVQLRSSQKKQGKPKRPRYSGDGDLKMIHSNTRNISKTTFKIRDLNNQNTVLVKLFAIKDLQALTLVGLTRENCISNPSSCTKP